MLPAEVRTQLRRRPGPARCPPARHRPASTYCQAMSSDLQRHSATPRRPPARHETAANDRAPANNTISNHCLAIILALAPSLSATCLADRADLRTCSRSRRIHRVQNQPRAAQSRADVRYGSRRGRGGGREPCRHDRRPTSLASIQRCACLDLPPNGRGLPAKRRHLLRDQAPRAEEAQGATPCLQPWRHGRSSRELPQEIQRGEHAKDPGRAASAPRQER